MREDESPYGCYGRRNGSLAYNWRLGRAMVLGCLPWRLIALCFSMTGICRACIFSLVYPVFLFPFPFSVDTAWPHYNVVNWTVD